MASPWLILILVVSAIASLIFLFKRSSTNDQRLCKSCCQIDFDDILSRRSLSNPTHICSFEHTTSTCPLCRFFQSCYPQSAYEDEMFSTLALYVKPTGAVFGWHNAEGLAVLEIHLWGRKLDKSCHIIRAYTGLSGRYSSQCYVDDDLIKEWLKSCDDDHPGCKDRILKHTPGMQVIDCVKKVIVPFYGGTQQYVTLSYVWGACNVEEVGTDLSIKEQPKVIEDAIAMVTRLGFRYLWIDRYCIPQNNKEVRRLQIQDMGRIYADSVLTIIVAAGIDPTHGIPGVSSTPRIPKPSIQIGHHVFVGVYLADQEIKESKWNTRGWTYQEALLAKRRLVFTDTQVYFQCQTMYCTDVLADFPKKVPYNTVLLVEETSSGRAFPSRRDFQKQRTVAYRINAFLDRDLSDASDALNAMSGIFALFSAQQEPISFLCGLPIFSIPSNVLPSAESMTHVLADALLWELDENIERRPCFPSWTWAGWKRKKRKQAVEMDPVYPYMETYTELQAPVLEKKYLTMDVKARFYDGKILAWKKHYAKFLQLSEFSIYPIALKIAAWMFRARVKDFSYTYPPALFGKLLQPYHSSDATSVCEVIGLVLAYNIDGYQSLILKPSKDGKSFERLCSDEVQLGRTFVLVKWRKKAQLGDLELEWKEIWLV